MSMSDKQADLVDTDFSRSAGGAAIGARLRRLSDRLDADAARVYASLGIEFEQRWFGVLNQLALRGPLTVGELATSLRITHVSVSQTRQSLEKAGYITSSLDPLDSRRRQLTLTSKGKALVKRLEPVWAAFDEAAAALNAEVGDAVAMLNRLDDALTQRSMFSRIVTWAETSRP